MTTHSQSTGALSARTQPPHRFQHKSKAGGIGETLGIIVTGISAATLTSATFAGLIVALLTPLTTLFGVPEWLVIALLLPVIPAALWVFVWMFLRTVRTERRLSADPSGAGLP